MQVGAFFRDDRALNRTNLKADATVDAGCEVDPIPVGSFGVFSRTGVNAGNGAGINTVGNAFACVGNNCMGHRVLSKGIGKWEAGKMPRLRAIRLSLDAGVPVYR